MIYTQSNHHETLLTQLLMTGGLVVSLAPMTIKATAQKIRTRRNRNAQGRKEGTR